MLFTSHRQLAGHLIGTHGYVKCAETRCGRVFRQRSQMERHYAVHGLAGRPAPAADSREERTGLSWSETEGLTRETLEYLGSVVALTAEERNKEKALRGLTVKVLDGLTTEQPDFPLSLYLHAVEVAMGLPSPFPPASFLPLPSEHNGTSNAQPESPPPNQLSSSSDNLDRSEDAPETAEQHQDRKRKRSPSPPVTALQPPNSTSNGDSPALLCIEEPCTQRFHTPKDLLEHLENDHYRLKKPCS